MKTILIFDADNTIWDTDAIFRGAQLALLETLAKAKLIAQPDSQLETLRIIDQALVSKLEKAEYDFKLLSTALTYFYSHKLTVDEAVNAATTPIKPVATQKIDETIEEAYKAFKKMLKQVPPFYAETIPVLSAIRTSVSETNPLVTILLSEGNYTRLEHILEAHNIRRQGLFDEIIIASKSKEVFEEAKVIGLRLLPQIDNNKETVVLIGDSLHRDIKFGNQAGFITVYKPSAFKGVETPNTLDEQPRYTIKNLGELPLILREDLGLPIPTTITKQTL